MTFWWDSDNYGQIIQCFALQNFLTSQGYEPFLIRYRPSREHHFIISLKQKKTLRHFLGTSRAFVINHFRNRRLRIFNNTNPRFFKKFIDEHLNSSSREFLSLQDLIDHTPEAEIYVVGSDQVWNIGAFDNRIEPWFLSFAPRNRKRIAYAASFGRANLSEDELSTIAPLIKKFHAVGVREIDAVKICSLAGYPKANHVLDPCFLLTKQNYFDYFKLSATNPDCAKKNLFAYILSGECIPWEDVIHWATGKDLTIRPIPAHGSNESMPFKNYFTPSIEDWVRTLAHAEYSIITSFHGLVFSIIFEKPFLVFIPSNWNRGNRILSLLEQLELTGRIYSKDKGDFARQIEAPIDWFFTNSKLEDARKLSAKFLLDSLST